MATHRNLNTLRFHGKPIEHVVVIIIVNIYSDSQNKPLWWGSAEKSLPTCCTLSLAQNASHGFDKPTNFCTVAYERRIAQSCDVYQNLEFYPPE